jgi:hypothetical protein
MLKGNISHTVKVIGLSFLLPAVLLTSNGTVASDDYAGSLVELLKNTGKAGADELCLVSDKVSETAKSTGIFGKIGGVFGGVKDKISSSFFDKSIYCKKDIITVALQTAEEVDIAIVQTSETLHSALIALEYKEEDLRELARIKKADLGTSFTKQALGNVEKNSKVIEKWSSELSNAVEKRKHAPLGAEAQKAFAKAVGNLRGAYFHQTKALIGIYLLKEYALITPKKELATLILNSKRVGLPENYWTQFLPRLASAFSNIFQSGMAGFSTDKVFDDSESKAIADTTGDKAVDRARKESIAAAKQIESKSSFANLPPAQEQLNLTENEPESGKAVSTKQRRTETDTAASEKSDAKSRNFLESATKLIPSF